jgi:hypothetical protein
MTFPIRTLSGFSALRLAAGAAFVVLLACCTQEAAGPGPVDPGQDTVPLTPVPRPFSLKISGTLSAELGADSPLLAVLEDSSGAALTGTIVWASEDSTIASVSAGGVVRAVRIGTVTITASHAFEGDTLRDSVSFTGSLAPYTFVFADTVSPLDRRLILDAVRDAHTFQGTSVGRAIAESTVISAVFAAPGCSQGGAAAFAGPRAVTFCLGNPGWKTHGPVIKQKIVQHELFHVWQFESGWITNPATAGAMWIIEGSAELMGFRGIEARGLLPFATAVGCQVKESSDFATRQPPGLPPLQSVEGRQAFQMTQGPLYTHSMLAMAQLTGTTAGADVSGLVTLRVYGDSVAAGMAGGWPAAFAAAFGKSPASFYGDFPGHLSSLAVPPEYLCRL